MLKIKDCVDLRILSDYGFGKPYNDDYESYVMRGEISIEDDSRKIKLTSYNTDMDLDLLFKLIIDGLVEKVE